MSERQPPGAEVPPPKGEDTLKAPAAPEAAATLATCTCLKTIKQKLSEHHQTEVDLELKQTVDVATLSLGRALPPLYYSYREGRRRKRSFVVFTFCPFCGKRYG